MKPLKRLVKGGKPLAQYTSDWGNSIVDRLNALTPRQGKGTRLTQNANGFDYSVPPPPPNQAAAWDLIPGTATGDIQLNPGIIRKGFSYQPTNVTITDVGDDWVPVQDDVMYLQASFTTGIATISTMTLVCGATWTEWPEPFDWDTSTPKEIEEFYFLLWAFYDPTAEISTDLTYVDYFRAMGRKIYKYSDTITAVKMISDYPEYSIVHYGVPDSGTNGEMRAAPWLIPSGTGTAPGIT